MDSALALMVPVAIGAVFWAWSKLDFDTRESVYGWALIVFALCLAAGALNGSGIPGGNYPNPWSGY